MTYILRNADNEIVGWSEEPFVPGADQAQEELAGWTLVDVSGLFDLSADKEAIVADGVDVAVVTVSTHYDPAPPSIDVEVNGVTVNISLVGGVGAFNVTTTVPGAIVIHAADRTLYPAAGNGTLVIIAEEN